MPRPRVLAALALAPASVLLAPAIPRSTGMLPTDFGAPPNLTSQLPACGQCHSGNPNANGLVTMSIATIARVLAPGQAIEVAVRVDGGPGLGLAGFAMETDVGEFVDGTNTRTIAGTGPAITHVDKFDNRWTFKYQAPTTPGPVRFTGVGQSVNANNSTSGDSFGFYGPDSNIPGVPYMLFVNGAHLQPIGAGCAGTDGHLPLLGARAPARVNVPFQSEVHAIPGGRVVFAVLGSSTTTWNGLALPLDLGIVGAPGCAVLIDQLIAQSAASTGFGSGGGVATFTWPIPNNPRLVGRSFFFQAFVQDARNPLGLTASNALRAVVQP